MVVPASTQYRWMKQGYCPWPRRKFAGQTSHPLYKTWESMKARCDNPNASKYHNYGGRGIQVCSRWKLSFWNFVEDMGPRPTGYTLDRINNDGDYAPDNCRWASHVEQNNNTRRPRGSIIKYKDRKKCWRIQLGDRRQSFYTLEEAESTLDEWLKGNW